MFSYDPADWIEYAKRQFRQILGRLTRMIAGTLDTHLARHPDDEWARPPGLPGRRRLVHSRRC